MNLQSVKSQLEQNKDLILLEGFFQLTKTQNNYSKVILKRERELELSVLEHIEKRANLSNLFSRYQSYDPSVHAEWPNHAAVSILCGIGSICSGQNIFMFFPHVLGLQSKDAKDNFGIEFIDVWKNIFQASIFPCIQKTFHLDSQLHFYQNLYSQLDKTIYLAAAFHEIGHQAGPFRVSPTPRLEMKLSGFELDVLGELSTDSQLILALEEFPEIAQFVILQRLFWFGRRGFYDNPKSAKINIDNDAWIAAYLWQKLCDYQVLQESNGKMDYNRHFLRICFSEILKEIDSLYSPDLPACQQQKVVQTWMKSVVPYSNDQFYLPEKLAKQFLKCTETPEIPHFRTTFAGSELENLQNHYEGA